MLIDSHCHLDPEVYGGDEGVDAAIARAREAGVTGMVTIGSGYGFACAERALAVARRHADVWCALGVHPHDASQWTDAVADIVRRFAAEPDVVAIGEMGLDFYYDNSPRDVQRRVLREQLALALDLDRPIVIHDRDSDGECLEIVRASGAFDGRGVVWHCFTGDLPYMRRIVEAGGFVSIPGIVTFKNAGPTPDVAREVPLDRLLVETDSPFLTPVPYRGRKNEPARVVHVAEKVAELRGMEPDELSRVTAENARRFFGLPRA